MATLKIKVTRGNTAVRTRTTTWASTAVSPLRVFSVVYSLRVADSGDLADDGGKAVDAGGYVFTFGP